jgi:hypothetical protein
VQGQRLRLHLLQRQAQEEQAQEEQAQEEQQ